ncbi:helix-turn-helix domain-containing protein [Nocardioides humi]|uniref:Cupin domain-containing protein n=1 Tax=Nocardioides humi TaxID=449461 RepID=A0ABN2BQZ5_9ACTN|nr:cupin domain-containing protein [Nocardioides humi]
MTSSEPVDGAAPVDLIGPNVRAAREAQGMSLRELARRIGVSPSFISQLERNKANASVGTLYALVDVLGLSIDQLMAEQGPGTEQPAGGRASGAPARGFRVDQPLQPAEGRARIQFPGVVWERLTQAADPQVDFLHVTYAPGSASCPEEDMMRHGGHEYGFVVSGSLTVQVGFESYAMTAGDAITFDSMTPHRLSNDGTGDCVAIWVVVGRRDDVRGHDVPVPPGSVTHLPSLSS